MGLLLVGVFVISSCSSAPPASDFAEAIAALKRYEALKAKLPQAWASGDLATARAFDTEGPKLAQSAKLLFTAANVRAAKEPDVLEAHADTLVALGHHDLAAEEYGRALETNGDSARCWAKYGTALAQTGQVSRPEAVTALRKALELEGTATEAADTWYTLGDLYHRASRYEFAMEAYEQALSIAPGHVQAHIGRSALKTRDGNLVEASAEIDALGPAAQQHDAFTRVLLRKALDDFDHFRRIFQDTPENHRAYARLLYRASRPTDAILAAQRATKLVPSDDKTWYFLGQIHTQLGNAKKAIEAYEKSLLANPAQPQLSQSLEQFKQQVAQQQAQTPPQP